MWLTQQQMAELFQTTKQHVSLRVLNIFKEGELQADSAVKESLASATDGNCCRTKFYNFDVIISAGYPGEVATMDAVSNLGPRSGCGSI